MYFASYNASEHKQHLHHVFSRLDHHDLKLHLTKCVLGKSSVGFLGCLITPVDVKILPQKVLAIVNFPKSETVAELKCFLAMLNFDC